MKLTTALEMLQNFEKSTCDLPGGFRAKISCPKEPINKWLPIWHEKLCGASSVSGREVMSMFGVYLIATYPDEEVIYVGKATPGARADPNDRGVNHHLAGEMFVHIGSPPLRGRSDIFLHRGKLLSKSRMTEESKLRVKEGNLLIALAAIEPRECASYLETYLQAAIALSDGVLPQGNDRIG
jgi:hypothetical protein